MTIPSRREAARMLRAQAESLRRHGFTNFFEHQYVCLLANAVREERCQGCLLQDYAPEEYRNEAFPCQHFDEETWQRLADRLGLPEEIAARFEAIAEELEATVGAAEFS